MFEQTVVFLGQHAPTMQGKFDVALAMHTFGLRASQLVSHYLLSVVASLHACLSTDGRYLHCLPSCISTECRFGSATATDPAATHAMHIILRVAGCGGSVQQVLFCMQLSPFRTL